MLLVPLKNSSDSGFRPEQKYLIITDVPQSGCFLFLPLLFLASRYMTVDRMAEQVMVNVSIEK